MTKKIIVKIILTSVVLLLLSGCTISIGTGTRGKEGGVWKSFNGGKDWEQKNLIPTVSGKPGSIAGVEINEMAIDPQDNNAIYLATHNSGIIYSYDGGESWKRASNLNYNNINAVVVDPDNKCAIYAATGNKLIKSFDCSRTWNVIYYHQNPDVIMTDVVVDYLNNKTIYASNTDGQIIKSIDGGTSWRSSIRIERGKFKNIVMDQFNNTTIYAATEKNGIYKTTDAGLNWQELSEGLKSYSNSHQYVRLVERNGVNGGYLMASNFGLLKTSDGGATWEVVNILPEAKETRIYALAVDPKNENNIYYATRTALVMSKDGGNSWISRQLPFERAVSDIMIDPNNGNIVYMATYRPD